MSPTLLECRPGKWGTRQTARFDEVPYQQRSARRPCRSPGRSIACLATLALAADARAQTVFEPETTLDSAPPPVTGDATPAFAFSASEPGSRFECRHHRADDAAPDFAACDSPLELGPLADGAWVFEVRAVDLAGTPDATPARTSFEVDTRPPDTSIVGAPGDTTAATAVFLFSATGAALYSCRLDGSAWQRCDSPHTYSGLSLGPHRFEVKAADEAGNEDPSAAVHTWQVLRPGLVIPGTVRQATALAAELVQMRRALARVRLGTLRRHMAVTFRGFDAITAGEVEVDARAQARRSMGRRRSVTVLTGGRELARAGRYTVPTAVTARGRRLVRGRELALELRLSFTDLAGRSLWAGTKVELKGRPAPAPRPDRFDSIGNP